MSLRNSREFNFGLDPDIEEIRDMVRRWTDDRLAPMAEDIDRKNEFPREPWREMGQLGLLAITANEDFVGT